MGVQASKSAPSVAPDLATYEDCLRILDEHYGCLDTTDKDAELPQLLENMSLRGLVEYARLMTAMQEVGPDAMRGLRAGVLEHGRKFYDLLSETNHLLALVQPKSEQYADVLMAYSALVRRCTASTTAIPPAGRHQGSPTSTATATFYADAMKGGPPSVGRPFSGTRQSCVQTGMEERGGEGGTKGGDAGTGHPCPPGPPPPLCSSVGSDNSPTASTSSASDLKGSAVGVSDGNTAVHPFARVFATRPSLPGQLLDLEASRALLNCIKDFLKEGKDLEERLDALEGDSKAKADHRRRMAMWAAVAVGLSALVAGACCTGGVFALAGLIGAAAAADALSAVGFSVAVTAAAGAGACAVGKLHQVNTGLQDIELQRAHLALQQDLVAGLRADVEEIRKMAMRAQYNLDSLSVDCTRIDLLHAHTHSAQTHTHTHDTLTRLLAAESCEEFVGVACAGQAYPQGFTLTDRLLEAAKRVRGFGERAERYRQSIVYILIIDPPGTAVDVHRMVRHMVSASNELTCCITDTPPQPSMPGAK